MPRARNTRRRMRRRQNRRHSSKQRGGQVSPSQNPSPKPLTEWFAALSATGLLGKPETLFTDVRREELAIPAPAMPVTSDASSGGDDYTLRVGQTNELTDYRVLAGQLAESPFLRSQEAFQDVFDEENADTLKLLQQYENDLRTAAQLQLQQVESLADKTNYPLLVWFLAANYVGSEEAVAPVLIPFSDLTAVSESLRSRSQPTPSEPTE